MEFVLDPRTFQETGLPYDKYILHPSLRTHVSTLLCNSRYMHESVKFVCLFWMVCSVFLFWFGRIIGPQCQHIGVPTWCFLTIRSAGVGCSSFCLIIRALSSAVSSPLLGRSLLRSHRGWWVLGFTLLDTCLRLGQGPRSWLYLSRALLSYCPPLLAVSFGFDVWI